MFGSRLEIWSDLTMKKKKKKTPTEQEQDDLETGGRIWRVIGILMKTTTTTEYSA